MAIKENDINCYRKCKQTQIDFTINIWLGMLRHKQGCYLPFQAWPEANSSWHSWLTSTKRLSRQKNWHLGNDLSSIPTHQSEFHCNLHLFSNLFLVPGIWFYIQSSSTFYSTFTAEEEMSQQQSNSSPWVNPVTAALLPRCIV